MIWFVLLCIAVVTTALVVIPVWRRTHSARPRSEFDSQIYHDQLAEVEIDAKAGRITAAQAESARTEIARRLLATTSDGNANDDTSAPVTGHAVHAPRRGISAFVAVALPIATFGVYLIVGSPHLPGRPAAEVKAQLPATTAPDGAALLARVAEQLKNRPDDLQGWTLYAKSLVRIRRFDEAVTAYRRVVSLAPRDADLSSRLAETQIFAAKGAITPEARQTLQVALALDAGEPRARFYMGLAEAQVGRVESALSLWIALEADSGPDVPWRKILNDRIAKLAPQANVSPDQLAARRKAAAAKAGKTGAPTNQVAEGLRGPTSADVKAAQSMSSQDRMSMIRNMVAGLAERLKEQPDNIAGWQRLARSYGVLGEAAKARDAYAHLAKKQPDNVNALSDYANSIAKTLEKDANIPAELATLGDQILELDSKHTGALWLTGLARAQSGDSKGARERWTRLLALLDPKSPQRADVEKNLKTLEN